jgi:hypothetical protein
MKLGEKRGEPSFVCSTQMLGFEQSRHFTVIRISLKPETSQSSDNWNEPWHDLLSS